MVAIPVPSPSGAFHLVETEAQRTAKVQPDPAG